MNLRDVEDLGFRPIQYEDEKLFRNFFIKFKERKCYSSSWLYITQAARGIGGLGYYFYHEDDFIVALGFHQDHFVLIHPMGKFPKNFYQVIKSLYDLSGKPIYLKKALEKERFGINELIVGTPLEITSTDDYPWDEIERDDDDTFPEIIIYIPDILNGEKKLKFTGKHMRNIRNKLNKWKNIEDEIEYLTLSKKNKIKVIKMLIKHFGKDKINVRAYLNMINILIRNRNKKRYIHFVAYHENQPIGFFAAEKLDKYSAGLYASISLRTCKGLAEKLHMEMFKRLNERRIKFLNLGGSEIEGLYNFKLKFTYNKKCFYEERKIPIIVLTK